MDGLKLIGYFLLVPFTSFNLTMKLLSQLFTIRDKRSKLDLPNIIDESIGSLKIGNEGEIFLSETVILEENVPNQRNLNAKTYFMG